MQTDATLLTNNSQHCWMLHVVSVCTPCCMLLDVVSCCCAKFETGQTFSPVQTDGTLLANNSQRWELLRPFARSLSELVKNNSCKVWHDFTGSRVAFHRDCLQGDIVRFHMTLRRPYWCSKPMKRRPCWCSEKILWELNSFLM